VTFLRPDIETLNTAQVVAKTINSRHVIRLSINIIGSMNL